MFECPRHRYAPYGLGLVAFVALSAGCGQPVREDRSINWSREGESVGLQHGQEGVFLADKNGRKLTKIFQPDPGVIVTSAPLWSPKGKRVIFTSARSPSGQPAVLLPFLSGAQDPAGRIHLQQDIVYTCWLYEQADGEKPSDPVALFEATADHTGYVAANLAVRWHPRLERIEYVKQVGPHQHGLFEFDVATKESRQIFPHTSEALLFDWTPDGARLACVLGSTQKGSADGIWIGDPAQADWWHVPHSGELALGEFGSVLENLRATRPAWTSDGSQFVFSSYVPGATPQQPGCYFLRHATLATRALSVWADGAQPFCDAMWDKADVRLGFVRGRENGALHVIQRGEPLSPAVNRVPVRRFAGWNSDGKHLAYIAPDTLPLAGDEPWALLLLPDAKARDRVFVAAGNGKGPGEPVFSGMRVTFPQWSPHEDKLSLWVTFMPAYRSVVSHLLGWGLRPGDPAAVFDLQSRQLDWMPVNAQEKVQVGHYYLLKRDYAQAERWYREAEGELPPAAAAEVRDFTDYLRALQGPRDFSFFHYYCLSKLGRAGEARAKLDQFPRLFLPRFIESADGQAPATVIVDGKTLERHLQDLLDPGSFVSRLLQDLYAAEVFLSLDAARDAEVFFQAVPGQVDTSAARLSRSIVLGQVFLLEKKRQEYADLVTETIGPLLIETIKPAPAGGARNLLDPALLTEFIGGLAVLPLGAPEFLSGLPEKQRQDMLTRWEKLQTKTNARSRPLVDFVLYGLYKSLGREKEWQEAAARLKNRSADDIVIPPMEGEIGTAIVNLHTQMQELLQRQ